MAGFFKANYAVEYAGANSSWLPEHGRLIPSSSSAVCPVIMPRLFREHLDLQASNAPLSVAALEDLQESLIGTDSIQDLSKSINVRIPSDRQMLVTFPGDVSVQLALANNRIESHAICGFTLGGMTAETGLIDHYPKRVRTWGEAWLAPDDPKLSLFSGLLTLPNEVGIVTDRIYRYGIDEPETLKNRDSSYFGLGRSKVYDRAQWIRYAGKYFELRNQTVVEACLNQAEQLAETKAQLKEAGFTVGVFELLTGQSAPQVLLECVPQLFSFDADNRRVWGHNHTGCYFLQEEPNIVFES